MHPRSLLTVTATSALIFFHPISLFARSGAYVYVSSQETVAGSGTTYPRYNTNPAVLQPASDSFAYDGTVLDVRASASLGVNRLYEEINVSRYTDTSDYGFVAAESFWADDLTIGKTGQAGAGTFSASVRVVGTFLETVRVVGDQIQFGASLELNRATTGLSFNENNMPASVDQLLTLTNVSFTFGTPFEINVLLSLSAGKNGGFLPSGSARFVGDLGNSITWEGVSEVRDAQGNLVTGFTANGSSGTDYTQPIPEPATGSLLALGLCAFGARRRTAGRH